MPDALIKLPQATNASSVDRVQMAIRSRFNPIRGLTPELLASYLDNFRLGFFRNAAITWDAMERRDSRLQTVAPKRKKAVARLGWEILTTDDTPEAEAQKEALEYFYNNVSATSALEPDENGGLSLLVRQMMDSIGKRYAVHEIVWQPSPAGLSAKFVFCPLWWFEGTKGKLRFLTSEFGIYGVDMEQWAWLVTCGDGIMEACSVAYIFKQLPLKDLLAFSEKFGMPGLLGKTDASKDSPEWDAMKEALQTLGTDWAAVMNTGAEVTLLEVKSQGNQPFMPIIERMDEEMTRLWRGQDLGTSSKDNATGASLQQSESDILETDDAQLIGETLTNQVSRFVLQYHFGDAPQLAYIKIRKPEKKNVDTELKVDSFLVANGAPRAIKDVLEFYGRPVPDAGEELLQAPAAATPQTNGAPNVEVANDVDQAQRLASAVAADLQPLLGRLNAILAINDPDLREIKLRNLLAEFDQLKQDLLADPESAKEINRLLVSGLVAGMTAKTKPA